MQVRSQNRSKKGLILFLRHLATKASPRVTCVLHTMPTMCTWPHLALAFRLGMPHICNACAAAAVSARVLTFVPTLVLLMALPLSNLPTDVLCMLLTFLGVRSAPLLIACHSAVCSAAALRELRAVTRLVQNTLRIPLHISSLPLHDIASAAASYVRLCRFLSSTVQHCVRQVEDMQLAYPTFADRAPCVAHISAPRDTASPMQMLLRFLNVPDGGPVYGIFSCNPLAAWYGLNGCVHAHRRTVREFARLLRMGSGSFAVTPCSVLEDRRATFRLSFSVLGVCGALVAVEPFADEVSLVAP